jgi:hypothetical protein
MYENRPRPLADAGSRLTKTLGTLGALVTALAGAGIALLTAEQADALTAILGAIPGVVGLVATALTVFGVVKKAEPQVTPVVDPKTVDPDSFRLVRLVPENR